MARSAMTRMRRHTASAATRCSHRRSTTTPTRRSIRTTRTRARRLPLSTSLPSNPRAAPSPHSPRLHAHTTHAHARSRLAACTPTRAHSRQCAVRTTWTRRQRSYSVSTHSHSTTRAWAWAARARPIFRACWWRLVGRSALGLTGRRTADVRRDAVRAERLKGSEQRIAAPCRTLARLWCGRRCRSAASMYMYVCI